jgi:hypothetical protein
MSRSLWKKGAATRHLSHDVAANLAQHDLSCVALAQDNIPRFVHA